MAVGFVFFIAKPSNIMPQINCGLLAICVVHAISMLKIACYV